MPAWLKRVRTIFRRRTMERELDAELQFHLDMQTAEYVRQGLGPEVARRHARQLFGGLDGIKDHVRDAWLTRLLETFTQDIRYGLRGLRKQPGYALAVAVTMTLGIGANTAIFSVVNAVVLEPLPYARGEDLLLLRQTRTDVDNAGFSILDLDDIRRRTTALDAVVEYHNMYFILLGGVEPERVAAGVVSWDFFQTLGVTPLLGRTFRVEDDGHDARSDARPEPRVLATRVRRTSGCDRPRRRDERSPAHDCGRAPRPADVSPGERRVHAAIGVSFPDESGRP